MRRSAWRNKLGGVSGTSSAWLQTLRSDARAARASLTGSPKPMNVIRCPESASPRSRDQQMTPPPLPQEGW